MAFQFLPMAFLKNKGVFEDHRAKRPLLCVLSYHDHGLAIGQGLRFLCGLPIQRPDGFRFQIVAERSFAVLLNVLCNPFAHSFACMVEAHGVSSHTFRHGVVDTTYERTCLFSCLSFAEPGLAVESGVVA